MTKPPREIISFPSKEAVLAFIRESRTPVGKREIVRAFHLTGDHRVPLKALLKELEEEGAIARGRGKRLAPPDALPAIAVLEVTSVDLDGEVLARPAVWFQETPPPGILMQPERKGHPALAVGDRVLARLERIGGGIYLGSTVRRLEGAARVLGIYRTGRDGGRVVPTDRRIKDDFRVLPNNSQDAGPGELVLVEVLPSQRLGLRQARVVERLGSMHEPRAASLIAIHGFGLPTTFPASALAAAERARVPPPDGRDDLRDVPLVTIDGADARDCDDAVFAEPDDDPANPEGWHLVVAIADVAYYVRPGTPLDKAAYERGNSCYFPDRVVPMLPEALSNDLCSLRPHEDRGCLAAHLWIDRQGVLKRHRFVRGLMRSAARLTYEQVQDAHDGRPDSVTGPLVEPVIAPLYGAYRTLLAARARRGTLDLDLPERRIVLDDRGRVTGIAPRIRLDSHRLIEEFMICANVAAAEALEARGSPCMYRVHDQPAPDKLDALREFLGSLDLNPKGQALKGQVLQPVHFTRILEKVAGRPEQQLIHDVILRSQAQAAYSPENIGHFGLALTRYAHFTSPIRRYADLIVHRALIRAHGLGPGGLDDEAMARLDQAGEHISATERRASAAERDAIDRHVAAYLADRVGAAFSGRIGGVTRFGLFVRLDETGADGLVPVSTLPDDHYAHVEHEHALIGQRWGRVYRLGAPVKVKLVEADPILGSTLFAILEPEGANPPRPGGRKATQPLAGQGARVKAGRNGGRKRSKAATPRGQQITRTI